MINPYWLLIPVHTQGRQSQFHSRREPYHVRLARWVWEPVTCPGPYFSLPMSLPIRSRCPMFPGPTWVQFQAQTDWWFLYQVPAQAFFLHLIQKLARQPISATHNWGRGCSMFLGPTLNQFGWSCWKNVPVSLASRGTILRHVPHRFSDSLHWDWVLVAPDSNLFSAFLFP